MESQQIVDKETGMLRPVRYQDIVILTRSPAGWTDTVTRILQEEGLPVLAESADGYFETLEIGWMMDYLRVLDNFRQDIPLVAVLKSPFGRMTNEELAQIRELNICVVLGLWVQIVRIQMYQKTALVLLLFHQFG